MSRDVDEMIREAFEPHPDSVERVVGYALAPSRGSQRLRRAAWLGLFTVAALVVGFALRTDPLSSGDESRQLASGTEERSSSQRWVIVRNSAQDRRGQILILYGANL